MSKVISVLFVAFLLLITLAHAARPSPVLTKDSPLETQHLDVEEVEENMVEESCEGVGEEECLMRRTLVAHTDYIYTQKTNP